MGFDPKEIEIIATLARYHRKGGPKDGDEELRPCRTACGRVVAPLAAILRLADALDRSHFSVVRDVKLAGKGKEMTMRVRTGGHDAELELWAARRKGELFEQVFGARLTLEVEE